MAVPQPRDFDLDIACEGGIEEALEAAMAYFSFILWVVLGL